MKSDDEVEISIAEAVDYLRINNTFSEALEEVVRRKLAVSAAAQLGLAPTVEELREAAGIFCASRGLFTSDDMERWMQDIGITPEIFESYVKTSIMVSKFKDYLEQKAAKSTFFSDDIITERLRDLIFSRWFEEIIHKN